MLKEATRGVAAAVHTYYKAEDEDPTPHVSCAWLHVIALEYTLDCSLRGRG